MKDDEEDFGGTTQLRASNASIPCVEYETLHGRNIKIESSGTSLGNQMNTTTLLLLPHQMQSITK